MALLFMDDFDHYTTAALPEQYTAYISGTITSGGRYQNCFHYPMISKAFTESETIIIGMGIKVYNDGYFSLKNFSSNILVISFNYISGAISVSSPVNESVAGVYSVGEWFFFEAKIKISQTDGTVEIRVNGETVINYSGDTSAIASTTANVIYFEAKMDIDDLYICNDSGASNNDFLGDNRVEHALSSSAGYITQWTPSSGSNYENIDDAPSIVPCPDGDTTYNSTALASNKDSFVMDNLYATSGAISGVQISINAKKDDAGTRIIRGFVRIDGTNYYTDSFSLSDTYLYHTYIWQISPATSSPWTISEINAAEFGYELVS